MFLIDKKSRVLEHLTGVHGSKLNYYTELKEKIAEISKRNTQLEILNEIGRQINLNTSLEEIIENVYEELKKIIPFGRVSLLILENGRLFLRSFSPSDEICQKGMEILPEQGQALWHAVKEAKQMVWNIETGIPDGHMQKIGLQIAVINALIVSKEVLGLFVLSNYEQVKYDKMDLSFLQQLSYQLALCIWNQKLFAEVTQAKGEWEVTFKAVKNMIIVVDHDLRILRVNPAAIQFCGLSEENLIGKKCCEVICFLEEPACADCVAKKVMEAGETAVAQRQLADGRIIEFYGYPAFDLLESPAVVISGRDITEKMKMQSQLLQNARLAALGEMSAGIAHELNTPLAVILGNAQLLMRDNAIKEQGQKLLENIKNCASRCKNIVQGLLSFSRQEQYDFEPLSLNDVVQSALDLVAYHIETSSIEISAHLAEDLPLIEGHKQQLEQVVVNLLLNAKQAVDAREGRRFIDIVTAYCPDSKEVCLVVRDSGCGMSREKMMHIFDPFFTSNVYVKGTGLGLSISLGIVQAHQGTIKAESEDGKGSTFTVKIPVLCEGEEFS